MESKLYPDCRGKFILSLEQIKILYNLEYYKIVDDIDNTLKAEAKKALKEKWLKEWQDKIACYFDNVYGSNITLSENKRVIEWISVNELMERIKAAEPENMWFKLVLIELVLFEPYFVLETEKDKHGNNIPCKTYSEVKPLNTNFSDKFINVLFSSQSYFHEDYVKKIRTDYKKASSWIGDNFKGAFININNYMGCSLIKENNSDGDSAYNVSEDKIMAFAAGGAAFSTGLKSYSGDKCLIDIEDTLERKIVSFESVKLLIAIKEIFLETENNKDDLNCIFEYYRQQLITIEKQLIDLKAEEEVSEKDKIKDYEDKIKNVKDSISAMTITKMHIHQYLDSCKK